MTLWVPATFIHLHSFTALPIQTRLDHISHWRHNSVRLWRVWLDSIWIKKQDWQQFLSRWAGNNLQVAGQMPDYLRLEVFIWLGHCASPRSVLLDLKELERQQDAKMLSLNHWNNMDKNHQTQTTTYKSIGEIKKEPLITCKRLPQLHKCRISNIR